MADQKKYAAHPLVQRFGASAPLVANLANAGWDVDAMAKGPTGIPPGLWTTIISLVLQVLQNFLNPPPKPAAP